MLATKEKMDEKAVAFLESGAALNYFERSTPIKARFNADHHFALGRLIEAQTGLSSIYGYNGTPFDSTTMASIDDAVSWTRQAVNWLVAFSLLEHKYVVSISLKQFLNEADWINFINGSETIVDIDKNMFPDQYHVRLRGIRLTFTDVSMGTTPAIIHVRAPLDSSYFHKESGAEIAVDQRNIPEVISGAILGQRDIRATEYLGSEILHNVSPLGEWKLKMQALSPTTLSINPDNDICIDLNVAVYT